MSLGLDHSPGLGSAVGSKVSPSPAHPFLVCGQDMWLHAAEVLVGKYLETS
jgi:hypothetical protein